MFVDVSISVITMYNYASLKFADFKYQDCSVVCAHDPILNTIKLVLMPFDVVHVTCLQTETDAQRMIKLMATCSGGVVRLVQYLNILEMFAATDVCNISHLQSLHRRIAC